MKTTVYLIIAICAMTLVSCELNISTEDDCLECTYMHQGRTVTQELCDAFGTEDEQDEMRDMMQLTADSLGVNLDCRRH